MTRKRLLDVLGVAVAAAKVENAPMTVSRWTLYAEVWAEPMTIVAVRYGVSASFLARICERLRVPRPARGYWARLKVGTASAKPPLPKARPGDELEWSREGDARREPRALPRAPEGGEAVPLIPTRGRSARHELIAGARAHFEGSREARSGHLRPGKKRLVDLFVSSAALGRALDVANALFLALEQRGHRVRLAPYDQPLHRPELDERSKGGQPRYDYRGWAPDRPTVVYIGTVMIGLTLFELSEAVEVQHANGKLVRVADLPRPTPKRRGGAPIERDWTYTSDMASGLLCLRASSPDQRASWEKQWRESEEADLASMVPQIVQALEAEAPLLAKLVAEGEKRAESARREWAAQQAKWRVEEEARRRARNVQESRDELFSVIESWAEIRQIESFFEDAVRRASALDDDARRAVMARLEQARALLGDSDALRRLQAWRTPDER